MIIKQFIIFWYFSPEKLGRTLYYKKLFVLIFNHILLTSVALENCLSSLQTVKHLISKRSSYFNSTNKKMKM